jgi:sigma-B regulation protein RsbU (phosphoserine phosphatase)
MNSENSKNDTDQKFHKTILEDFRNINLKKDLRYEYKTLRDFYLDSEKKARLESMTTFQRWIHRTGWLLKSMFLHLTPLRRIVVLVGVLFLLISRNVSVNDSSATINLGLIGGILILFVLFLELKDKLLARHELEAGRKVQRALMPEQNPEFPGWAIWLYTRPANEVGGDLVDYLLLDEAKAVLTLADVAGKGLKAALLTSKLQATVRALATEVDSLSELGKKINKIFHRDSMPNLFASMLLMRIGSSSGEINFLNAGHFPPFTIKDKDIKELARGSIALGLVSNAGYNEETVILEPNELFIAYSDGVIEARNESGEFFGTERFFQLIKNSSNNSPDQIGKYVISQIEQFIGDFPASDDISLIILQRNL